jgi:hypothetical protein
MRYTTHRDGDTIEDRVQEFETKREAIEWGDERESFEVYYLDYDGNDQKCYEKRPVPKWA